jgi:transposase-like protein
LQVKAVELSYQEDIQVQRIAAELDILPIMLSRWCSGARNIETARSSQMSPPPLYTGLITGQV